MNNLRHFIISTIKNEIFNTLKEPLAEDIASKVSFLISEMTNELGDDWEDYYAQIGIKEFKDQEGNENWELVEGYEEPITGAKDAYWDGWNEGVIRIWTEVKSKI